MAMTTGEFVNGGREIKLTDGSTVMVRAVRLADLQDVAQSIIGLLNADDVFKSIDLTNGLSALTGLLPNLLKLPEFLGGLCSVCDPDDVVIASPGEWFASLPLEDEFDILEAMVDVSNLERLLPRFFRLVGNLKQAMPTAMKQPCAAPSQA